MPLFNSQHQNDRRIGWLGIAVIVVVELLILLALAFAVVRYVGWSSDAAQAEFMSGTKPSASDPNHSGEFSTAIQPLNGASRAYFRPYLTGILSPHIRPGSGIGRAGVTRAINRSGTRLAQLRDFEIANC